MSGLQPYWYTPSRSVIPTFEQTQQRAYQPGPQRSGQTYTGPIGPISVGALKARITQAQVRQSGASALSWARSLTGG